ncbi:MAG: hypothetical protein AAFY66_08810 [Pseudomonadota bacterium]
MIEGCVTLRHDGPCSPDAPGSEVIYVGATVSGGGGAPPLPASMLPSGWQEISDVSTGHPGQTLPYAIRGTGGCIHLPWEPGDRLLLLSHPWSGRVTIEAPGHPPSTFSLHAYTTTVLSVDPLGGPVMVADADAVWNGRLQELVCGSDPVVSLPIGGDDAPPDGMVRLRATGEKCGAARGAEVILLRAEPRGLGRPTDLEPAATRAGWHWLETLSAGQRDWSGAVKGFAGDLLLPVGPGARLLLLRHPWSGVTEITLGRAAVRVDLYAAVPTPLEIELDRLPELAEAMSATAVPTAKGVSDTASASFNPVTRVDRSARSAHYDRRIAGIDPARPLALYVPRWRGVALSTEMLFEQTLPVPPGVEEHPDEIGAEDVAAFAEILLQTGVRHFIVSGGDLFNLSLLREVQRRAPDRRFDLLWHSNFLQMGEPHDWNLLRHWLHALRDGAVTRVGVVKAGLEDWFAALDIDAVHVPNVVPVPKRNSFERRQDTKSPECGPRLGLWLSGSSPYRKTPLAALAASTMIPGARLLAAGLDESARRFVTDAQVPFERIWDAPLPRSMLCKQMRATDLTLYVTLSECSPMLPLESFALGVPCLIGPSCDLFADHDGLKQSLVVERPLAPAAIAEKAMEALAKRDEILDQYAIYHEALLARSRRQVEALVA